MRENATDEELPKRLQLVTSPSQRGTTSYPGGGSTNLRKEAQIINGFAEKDPNSDYYMVRKRPGYTSYYQTGFVGGDTPRGMTYYSPVSSSTIAVVQNKVFFGTVLLGAGAFQFSAIMCKFQPIPAVVPLVVIGNGSIFPVSTVCFTDGLTVTQIVDPNFPNQTVPGFAYLDGTLYVMTTRGYIYGSKNTDDPTTWDPLNVIRAQTEPDLAITLGKQLTYVVALKQWTTEFFYDAGNPTGSPLAPVQGAILPWGCVDAATLQDIDNLLIWVATNKTSSPQVIILEDLHIRVVSTPAIDRYLNAASITTAGSLFRSFVFKMGGHRFYVLTCLLGNLGPVFTNRTFVLDIDLGLWFLWSDANGGYWPVVACSTDSSGRRVLQSATDANVFLFDDASIYPSDNGSLVPVDIYTPNYDSAIDRSKMLSLLRVNADVTNGSILQMRYSDDDFQNWSNFQQFDLSIERPFVTDQGSFYRRAFHFRHQCNTDLRIKAVDLQLDLGTL